MLYRELTLEDARSRVSKGEIVYPVIKDNKIIKVFSYWKQAVDFCYKTLTFDELIQERQTLIWYNITHPNCPRRVKFELGYLKQYDMVLDRDAYEQNNNAQTNES